MIELPTNASDFTAIYGLIGRWGWPIELEPVNDDFSLLYEHEFNGKLCIDTSGRLAWQAGVLSGLYGRGDKISSLLFVDFDDPKLNYRLRQSNGGGCSELLARAVGINKRRFADSGPLKLVDATAGLGVDSWVLASLGAQVVMIERSPIMALLLADGLERAQGGRFACSGDIKLIFGEAKEYLATLAGEGYSTLYLDPMYPASKSSAARNRKLRIIHSLVGQDEDAGILLAAALPLYHRIAVKRPRYAPALDGPTPHWQMMGSSCRYDLYFNSGQLKAFPPSGGRL